ncbi:MAG: hypothetical protein ABJI69_09090 [Balneola sp.]
MDECYIVVFGISKPNLFDHDYMIARQVESMEFFVKINENKTIDEAQEQIRRKLRQKYRFQKVIHLKTEMLFLDEDDERYKMLKEHDFKPNKSVNNG